MSRNPNQRKIDMIETETACVLIEGPNCGDAGFFAGWLHAANEANEVLHRLMADPDADPRIQDVFMQYVPDFGWAACFFVRQLREKSCTFIVPWREELPELFCCLESDLTWPIIKWRSHHAGQMRLRSNKPCSNWLTQWMLTACCIQNN
jgi:hypothetical protein